MKYFAVFILIIFHFFYSTAELSAQPLRFVHGNDYDRDSIKLLRIKSFDEFVCTGTDSTCQSTLVRKVEYDTNGNLIRDLRINTTTGQQNQWSYQYSYNNLLIEKTTWFPDTLTRTQRYIYYYDSRGNEILQITEFYKQGFFVSATSAERAYDTLNRCIELKTYNQLHQLISHYIYQYPWLNFFQTEEITLSAFGDVLYRRPVYNYSEDEFQIYSLPHDHDLYEVNEITPVKYYFNPSDSTTRIEDNMDLRIYNNKNIVLYWYQKNYMHHWYVYTYFEK